MPTRPQGVPDTASWSPSDNEWVVAERDEAGRLQGLVRYFRPAGSLVCETEHVDGVPHGECIRFHETGEVSRRLTFNRGVIEGLDTSFAASGETTESCFPTAASPLVKKYEQVWKEGLLVRRVFRDAEGREVFPDGRPYPSRPPGVPEGALPEGDGWAAGAVDQHGRKIGLWLAFGTDGALRREERYEAGRLVPESAERAPAVRSKAKKTENHPTRIETLGTVLAPSGSLVVVDFGLMGGWSKDVATSVRRTLESGGGVDDALEEGNLVALAGVARSALPVTGTRNGEGRWAELWKHIEVKLGSAPVATVEEIGEVFVERARLMFADPEVLSSWVHDGTLDGLADLAFWGRDAELLAKAAGAKRLEEPEWGFTDLPVQEAHAKLQALGELVKRNEWMVRPDLREHDHHHLLLKAVKASPVEAAGIALSGAQLFGFFTGYGDGIFPVERCLDARGETVGIRVVLGTQAAIETLDALND